MKPIIGMDRSRVREQFIVNFQAIGAIERPFEPGEREFCLERDAFRAAIDFLASYPRRSEISISFDDFNKSYISIAVPILREFGLRADVFVLLRRCPP